MQQFLGSVATAVLDNGVCYIDAETQSFKNESAIQHFYDLRGNFLMHGILTDREIKGLHIASVSSSFCGTRVIRLLHRRGIILMLVWALVL